MKSKGLIYLIAIALISGCKEERTIKSTQGSTPVQLTPSQVTSFAITTDEDQAASGNLQAQNLDSTSTFIIIEIPTKGKLSLLNAKTGSFSYLPARDANGLDFFTYKVKSATSESNIAKVDIQIKPVNDAPKAQDISLNLVEDTVTQGKLLGSDVEGAPLTFKILTLPTKGTVNIINTSTGEFTFTPNLNANGTDTFTYAVNDGITDSAPATVNIQIDAVNDLPVANSQILTVELYEPLNINLSGSDPENEQLSYFLASSYPEVSGTLPNITFTSSTIGVKTLEFWVQEANSGQVSTKASVTINVIRPTAGKFDKSFGISKRGFAAFGDLYGVQPKMVLATQVINTVEMLLVGGDNSLFRLYPNGIIDASFGELSHLGDYGSTQNISAIKVLSDGKILVGGTKIPNDGHGANCNSNLTCFRLVRLLPTGLIDTTFGLNGYVDDVYNSVTPASSTIVALDTDASGNIIIGGYGGIGKLTANGQWVTSFGTSGRKAFVGTVGNIVTGTTAGIFYTTAYDSFTNSPEKLSKVNDNGAIVTSFGQNGSLTNTGIFLANLRDGRIATCKADSQQYCIPTILAESTGLVDSTFNYLGASLRPGAMGAKFDNTGKLLQLTFAYGIYDFNIVKVLPNGSLQSDYGTGGILRFDADNIFDAKYPAKVIFDRDGKLVQLADQFGHDQIGNVTQQFILMRLWD